MAGDDFCADCEPESRTVASFGCKEWLQNPVLKFCWNSWTGVADLYVQTVRSSAGLQCQGAPVWHRIDCVADQICQNLPDLTLTANDWWQILKPLSHNSDARSTQRGLEEGQR